MLWGYRGMPPAVLGFTHAFFPQETFDETLVEECWAFARLGEAYLAVYAGQGLALATAGEDAGRELRSSGDVWACQLGQHSQDGSFEDFCEHCRHSAPQISPSQLSWSTIRGDQLQVEEDGAFRVNGELQSADPPLTSPYATLDRAAKKMLVQFQELGLELNFE